MGLEWLDLAECRGLDPDIWFPKRKGPDTTALAQAICAICPVTAECLEFSMTEGRRYAEGIYGGLCAKERRTMRRRRKVEDERRAAS